MKQKLSVVIPNWNGEKHINAMLDSILAQTYKDWQAYIVDDCSTDNSWSILTTYEERDDRINIFKRNRLPKGAQTCRNIGIELAKDSKYICFFDSDDILAPWCFEQRVSFMDNNPEVECGIFPAKSFSGTNLLESGSFIFGYNIFNEPILESMLQEPLPIVGWTNIYRISAIEKYNLYWDEKILSKQDSDYNLMALIKGVHYVYANNANIDYFWRIDNSVSSITKKILSSQHTESHIYRLEKLLSYHPNVYMPSKNSILTYYLMSQFRIFEKNKMSSGIKKVLRNNYFHNKIWTKIRLELTYLTPTYNKYFLVSRKEHIAFPKIVQKEIKRWHTYQEYKLMLKNVNYYLSDEMINSLPII